jgi:FMN-dependent NADH-azoreductase
MIALHIDSSPRGVDSVSRCLTGQIVDRLKAVEPTPDGRANGLAHAVSAIEQMLDGCVEQAA